MDRKSEKKSSSMSAADPSLAVAAQLSELASILECSICNELMHLPASLLCGHSFCSACLRSALARARACPLCRQPCHTATALRTNIALAAVARTAFPAAAAERAAAASALAEQPAPPKDLPLFLTTQVTFPGETCAPHPLIPWSSGGASARAAAHHLRAPVPPQAAPPPL